MTPDNTKPEDAVEVLLPCPFCEHDLPYFDPDGDESSDPRFWVECVRCGSRGPEWSDPRKAKEMWNTRLATSPTPAPVAMREGEVERVSLADCPPGPFLFGDTIGFKTEYGAMEPVQPINFQGNEIRWTVGRNPDAYCLETGEQFWGGAASRSERANLMVRPIDPAILLAALRASSPVGEGK